MNPIIKLAASALPGEKKYVLFAGAGVSKDAGIPTAWDVMLETASLLYAESVKTGEENQKIDLENWFQTSEYGQMTYAELMDQLYPNYPDQQSFLKQALGTKPPGDVHYLIAELARRDIIRAIITTNFDTHLENVLEEKGLKVQVISNYEDLIHCEPLIHCKDFRIYKPHGTLGRGAIRNTPKDLEKLSPQMEEELIRVLSEHGVIVLGYSGRDNDIIRVFSRRNNNYYPLFWINPSRPIGNMERIFEDPRVTYIPCVGASQFLNDFINLQDRIKEITPRSDLSPTISDLKVAYSKKDPVAIKILDFLKAITNDILIIKPDFSKFDEYDDAIVNQIDIGEKITIRFIEVVQLVCNNNDEESIRLIYEYFGSLLKLYNIPDDFEGSFHDEDFDGNRFLVFEMFVGFIGSLIKFDKWELIGKLLSKDLFVDKKYNGGYFQFQKICHYIRSLDIIRNSRLQSHRISITADIVKDHFSEELMVRILNHQEFMEADFFLFLRTRCQKVINPSIRGWDPLSCVYLDRVPSFILKSESAEFLSRVLIAHGIDDNELLINEVKKVKTEAFSPSTRMSSIYRSFYSFDPDKLGTRK
jgi:hypothetical protein